MASGTPLPLDGDVAACSLSITDIAAGLAKINRFAGATYKPYSVAQHSVHVSVLVKRMGGTWADAMVGLLHDAHEVAVGDIPSPARRELDGICRMSRRVQLGIEVGLFGQLVGSDTPGVVKHADLIALATEKRDLLAPAKRRWELELPPPDSRIIKPVGWVRAQKLFIDRFELLKRRVVWPA